MVIGGMVQQKALGSLIPRLAIAMHECLPPPQTKFFNIHYPSFCNDTGFP